MNNEKEDKSNDIEITLPPYEVSETYLPAVKSIFNLNLEELIYEKMTILYEHQFKLEKDLFDKEIELQTTKDKIILETDFAKAIGKSRPNQADREAYIRPTIAPIENEIDNLKRDIAFYKHKIIIINDLIKARRVQLQIDAELIKDS